MGGSGSGSTVQRRDAQGDVLLPTVFPDLSIGPAGRCGLNAQSVNNNEAEW